MWTDIQTHQWKDPVPDYAIEGTNPTLTEVEDWLVSLSSQFDIALGAHWFTFPIQQNVSPTAWNSVSQYIVQLVADLCHFKNSSGRFFTERLVERGITPMAAILRDMNSYIEMNADGFVQDNVPQKTAKSIKKQIGFRVIG
ncbi:MAG: hypothetical protein ABIO63_04115 [Casimicrobiaceae bacterium]